jgi:hypothetical protein
MMQPAVKLTTEMKGRERRTKGHIELFKQKQNKNRKSLENGVRL